MTAALLDRIEELTRPFCLSAKERDILEKRGLKLLRINGFGKNGDWYVVDLRSDGDDYCCQCGNIAPKDKFTAKDRCSNPNCPRPQLWDD